MITKTFNERTHFNVETWNWSKLLCTVLFMSIVQTLTPHGTVTSPPSRVYACYLENPENPDSPPCIAAVASHGTQPLYDWNEINQAEADGQHMLYVMDGNLASGGRPEKYGGMDQVTSDWVATPVTPGPFTVTWTVTAPHATAYYDVYITVEDWTPDQPLTWDSLELLVRTPPSPAADVVDIPVTLPERTGKHVIYSIWQRSDSPEAFYSTSDVDFGILSTDDIADSSAYLYQNYPNPFSSTSTISYRIQEETLVNLKVYDVLGREISTLTNETQEPGEYEVVFNGEHLNSGIYFYVFTAGNVKETRRLIIQK